ncbi:class I SAM-dependent methyltransferase [Streptomyces sp. NPDC060022]|uniref:class I SAM-dependent methyltransferase n=1 Tax=Streptomyces sp. NPDC060022 TaxID=3347039 RepID=UPI0036C17FAE
MSSETFAPDGTPVALFARLGGGRSLGMIGSRLADGSSVLDLGCGAGRLATPLAELGHRVVGVDISPEMLAEVRLAHTVCSTIESLSLEERFDAVLLPSYFVNTRDPEQRAAFLRVCVEHVAEDGLVFIQRHDPGRVRTLDTRVRMNHNGIQVSLEDVSINGLEVSATLVYTEGDRRSRQPWEFVAFEESDLDAQLAEAGLRRIETDGELEWVVAVPLASSRQPSAPDVTPPLDA